MFHDKSVKEIGNLQNFQLLNARKGGYISLCKKCRKIAIQENIVKRNR
jgi:hypothetical protein